MSDDKTNDLAVLLPDREVTVAGETLTVREIRFGERVRHAAQVEALLTAMWAAIRDAEGQEITGALLDAVFASQSEAFATLMAVSVGKPREWLDTLSDADGSLLMYEFWGVNSRFFMRQLVTKGVLRHLAATAPSDGANSSPA